MSTLHRLRKLAATILIVVPSVAAASGDDETKKKDQGDEPAAPVTVFGHIVDADTQLPINRFMIQAGKFDPADPSKVTWGFSLRRTQSQTGHFRTTIRWHEGWTARILADGYLPHPVLAKAPPGAQGQVEVTLQLKRGRYVRGRVLDHAGRPVAGASVFAVGPTGVNLAGGKAVSTFGGGEDKNAQHALTDETGQFEIPVGGAKKLAVSSPDFEAWPMKLPEENEKKEEEFVIRLPKPGMLVVWYDIDGGPDEEEIFWQLLGHKMKGFEGVRVERTAKIANKDKLILSGLTPGKYQICRYRMLRTRQMGFSAMLERTFLTIEPGQIQVLRFARPKGVRVAGIVLGQQEVELSTVLIFVRPDPQPNEAKPGAFFDKFTVDGQMTDAEGRFKTDRLAPGNYTIHADGYPALTPQQQAFTGIVRPRYTGEAKITVPETGAVPKVELRLKDSQTGAFVK